VGRKWSVSIVRNLPGLLSKSAVVLAGALALSMPAAAQMSMGYKFLEAVKKKEGNTVTDMLAEPGTTVINTKDITSGDTALHIVTGRRDLTWMSFLISKGANVNVRNVRGVTPLELAVRSGFNEGVELLLAKGALVDEPNSAGETPLIAATHNRDTALMRLLLKAGADPDRADSSGRTARDYALADGRNSPLLTEIDTYAKTKQAGGKPRPSYGPSL
jgi:ankyrin repeat protein